MACVTYLRIHLNTSSMPHIYTPPLCLTPTHLLCASHPHTSSMPHIYTPPLCLTPPTAPLHTNTPQHVHIYTPPHLHTSYTPHLYTSYTPIHLYTQPHCTPPHLHTAHLHTCTLCTCTQDAEAPPEISGRGDRACRCVWQSVSLSACVVPHDLPAG